MQRPGRDRGPSIRAGAAPLRCPGGAPDDFWWRYSQSHPRRSRVAVMEPLSRKGWFSPPSTAGNEMCVGERGILARMRFPGRRRTDSEADAEFIQVDTGPSRHARFASSSTTSSCITPGRRRVSWCRTTAPSERSIARAGAPLSASDASADCSRTGGDDASREL
jgi:hypothetical protein